MRVSAVMSIIRTQFILLSLLATLPQFAQADGLADKERKLARLSAHRLRLEGQLTEQAKRIRRLKAQPPGVGHDFQLRSAL